MLITDGAPGRPGIFIFISDLFELQSDSTDATELEVSAVSFAAEMPHKSS